MVNYTVGYQLNVNKDYPKLWEELRRLNGHRAMNSFWLIDSGLNSAKAVRKHLANYVDGDDMLFVTELTERPSSRKCFQGTIAWLDARFGPEA